MRYNRLTAPEKLLASLTASGLPAALTYLGIETQATNTQTTGDTVPAVITAIDPNGPAAKVDLRPGDTIVGYGERRKNPPLLGEKAPAKYRFGLTIILSGAKSVRLEVLRNGERLQREVTPVLLPGGFRRGCSGIRRAGKASSRVERRKSDEILKAVQPSCGQCH